MTPAFMALWTAGLAMQIDYVTGLTGKKPGPKTLEGLTLGLYEAGKTVPGSRLLYAIAAIQQSARATARWHLKYDVWITPTLGLPPIPLGLFDGNERDPMKGFAMMIDYVPFTSMQNATGQPAINLPLHWNVDGLPIGTQFVGRVGEEALLLQLATQLEAAAPWTGRYGAIQ